MSIVRPSQSVPGSGLGATVDRLESDRPQARNNLIHAMASAIRRKEGTGVNNVNARNNNPGNLRSWGSNPVVGGYAMFPTPAAGWSALYRQIELNIGRGLTLEEFFAGKPGVYAGYAPSADSNDPVLYARNVSQWTGIPLGVKLNTLDTDYPYGMGMKAANVWVPDPVVAPAVNADAGAGAGAGGDQPLLPGIDAGTVGSTDGPLQLPGTSINVVGNPLTDKTVWWVAGIGGALVALLLLLDQ